MEAIKSQMQQFYSWLYGPYVKKVSPAYLVAGLDAKGVSKSYSLDSLSQGVTLDAQGHPIRISVAGELQNLEVPMYAKVEVLGSVSWKTMWNGSAMAKSMSQQTQVQMMPLALPLKDVVRVTLPGKVLTLSVGSMDQAQVGAPTDWVSVRRWTTRGVLSFFVHAGLLALLFFLRGVEMPWESATVDLTKTLDKLHEKHKQLQFTDVDVAGFDGSGMNVTEPAPAKVAVQAAAPTRTAKASDARAKAVSSALSGLAAKLSNMNFGAGSFKLNVSNAGSASGQVVAAAQSGLAKGQSTGLNSGLAQMAQGVIGKGMKWGLYGSNGQGVSQREIEEVGNIFRALQAEFRGCYESALLRDESLAVSVNYEGTVQGDGTLGAHTFDLTGTATPDGENLLKSCLATTAHKVRVSTKLTGAKIRNLFVFKS